MPHPQPASQTACARRRLAAALRGRRLDEAARLSRPDVAERDGLDPDLAEAAGGLVETLLGAPPAEAPRPPSGPAPAFQWFARLLWSHATRRWSEHLEAKDAFLDAIVRLPLDLDAFLTSLDGPAPFDVHDACELAAVLLDQRDLSAPSALCTMATISAFGELQLLLNSVRTFHPDLPIHVYGDAEIAKRLDAQDFGALTVRNRLDRFSSRTRAEMVGDGEWDAFMLQKADLLEDALRDHADALFIDSDMLVVAPLNVIDRECDVMLSEHGIVTEDEAKYGRFNGGFVWIRRDAAQFVQRWREQTPHSRFHEQSALEDLFDQGAFNIGVAPEAVNFAWWRVWQSSLDAPRQTRALRVAHDRMLFGRDKICLAHTHLLHRRDDSVGSFNALLMRGLAASTDARVTQVRRKVEDFRRHDKIVTPPGTVCAPGRVRRLPRLLLPRQPRGGMHAHVNDTFREIAQAWAALGLVDVEPTDSPFVWLFEEGEALLYDRPTMAWFEDAPPDYQIGLFGNPPPPGNGRSHPWIFWPRRPLLFERLAERRPMAERGRRMIFLGKVENEVQRDVRDRHRAFAGVCDLFSMVDRDEPYACSPEDYVAEMNASRFALLLAGFGSKCNRDVEAFGVGAAPIATPEVDLAGYFDPPIEGAHYLAAATPQEAVEAMAAISDAALEEMSRRNHAWYLRNCSVRGAFFTTMNIIAHA